MIYLIFSTFKGRTTFVCHFVDKEQAEAHCAKLNENAVNGNCYIHTSKPKDASQPKDK